MAAAGTARRGHRVGIERRSAARPLETIGDARATGGAGLLATRCVGPLVSGRGAAAAGSPRGPSPTSVTAVGRLDAVDGTRDVGRAGSRGTTTSTGGGFFGGSPDGGSIRRAAGEDESPGGRTETTTSVLDGFMTDGDREGAHRRERRFLCFLEGNPTRLQPAGYNNAQMMRARASLLSTVFLMAITGCSSSSDSTGSAEATGGMGGSGGTATAGAGGSAAGTSGVGGGAAGAPTVGYPPGPYGTREGDVLADLETVGYLKHDPVGLAYGAPFGVVRFSDIRETATVPYAIIHVSGFT